MEGKKGKRRQREKRKRKRERERRVAFAAGKALTAQIQRMQRMQDQRRGGVGGGGPFSNKRIKPTSALLFKPLSFSFQGESNLRRKVMVFAFYRRQLMVHFCPPLGGCQSWLSSHTKHMCTQSNTLDTRQTVLGVAAVCGKMEAPSEKRWDWHRIKRHAKAHPLRVRDHVQACVNSFSGAMYLKS